MKLLNGLTMAGVCAVLATATSANAQRLYPLNGATYNNSYGSPYQSQYTNPPVDNQIPRYNSVPYSRQNSNNDPYRSSDDVNVIRDDGRIHNSSYNRDARTNELNRVVPSPLSRQASTNRRGIIQHASDLYDASNAICWEMNRHYKHNANYAAVYRDIYEIKEAAKRLQAYVEQQGGRATATDSRVVSALHDMDRQFHEFEADLSRWHPASGYSPRTQLAAMIRNCETTLHAAMNDYGIVTRYREASHNQRTDPRRDERLDSAPRSRPDRNR